MMSSLRYLKELVCNNIGLKSLRELRGLNNLTVLNCNLNYIKSRERYPLRGSKGQRPVKVLKISRTL